MSPYSVPNNGEDVIGIKKSKLSRRKVSTRDDKGDSIVREDGIRERSVNTKICGY